MLSGTSEFVTTDYVVDELLTLLVAQKNRSVAVRIGNGFWDESTCKLEWTSRDDIAAAWKVFQQFDDKLWSFTDCISYVVMQRLGIREALSLDEHFRQFGFVTVKP